MQLRPELASDLLATGHYGASSLLLAQASGGNNSVKDVSRDVLWVKASGLRFRDLRPDYGTVALRYSAVREHIRRETALSHENDRQYRRSRHEYSTRFIRESVLNPGEGRPSLEAGFHALLSTVVLHLHPVYVNAFSSMEGGRALLADIGPARFAWIDYAAPGRELAVAIDQALAQTNADEVQCFVLAKHGFIASASNAAQVISATEAFLRTGQQFFGEISPELLTRQPPSEHAQRAGEIFSSHLRERWQQLKPAVRPAAFVAFQGLGENERLFHPPGALFPDDVVYAGGGIRRCSFSGLRELVWSLPDEAPQTLAVAVEGAGTLLFASGERLLKTMEETLLSHVLVRTLISRRGIPCTLPPEEIAYLEAMESEKYRIRVAATGAC